MCITYTSDCQESWIKTIVIHVRVRAILGLCIEASIEGSLGNIEFLLFQSCLINRMPHFAQAHTYAVMLLYEIK